jgi:isochorismate synthase
MVGEGLPQLHEAPAPELDEIIEFVDGVMAERLPAGKDFLLIAVPAPNEAPTQFLRLVPREMGFLWHAPQGRHMAGGGCVHRIDADGSNRLTEIATQTKELFERIHVRTADGITVVPTLFGGVSFAPNVPPIEPWEEFGSATLALSRWQYWRERDQAFLSLAARREEAEDPEKRSELVRELKQLLTALGREAQTSIIIHHQLSQAAIHHLPARDWRIFIERVQRAIASGRFAKIVAARRCVVDLTQDVEDTAFMSRLFASYPDCTHFAVRRNDATFLGATPETLFRKNGLSVETHALAGTRRVKDDPTFDAGPMMESLRTSNKDLVEHSLVVKKICDELLPLSTRIRYSSTPHVRRVRNLVHLQTPIQTDVKPHVDPFHLLDALHPTPAIGGFPAKEAVKWLAANEPLERGWFGGVVGWCDAAGNAEFAVSIRCGVLMPKRAFIYAGAGIVRDSDHASEYTETGAKMFPLVRALGVDTESFYR